MKREAPPPVAGGVGVAITTLMFRNLPRKNSKNDFVAALEQHVSMSTVDFMHVPRDWKANCNTGYAFVNFVDTASAGAAMVRMKGLVWPNDARAREIVIVPALVQGLVANVRNYMSKDKEIDFDHGPWVFIKGEPVPLHVALRQAQQAQARDAGNIIQDLALEFLLRAPQGGMAPDCISPPTYPSSFAEDLVPKNFTNPAHQHVQQVKARDAGSIGQGLALELWPSAAPNGQALGGLPPPPPPSSFAENFVSENLANFAHQYVEQVQARDAGSIGQGLALELWPSAAPSGQASGGISPPSHPSIFAENFVSESLANFAHQHVQQVKTRDAGSIGQGLALELWPSAAPSGQASGGILPPPHPSSFAENLVPENPTNSFSDHASGANASFVRRDAMLDQRALSSGGVTSLPAVGQPLQQWQDPAQHSSEGMVVGTPVGSSPLEVYHKYQMQSMPENCRPSSSDSLPSVSSGQAPEQVLVHSAKHIQPGLLFEDYIPMSLGATSSAAAARLESPRRDALLRSPKYAAARLQVTSLLQSLKQRGAF